MNDKLKHTNNTTSNNSHARSGSEPDHVSNSAPGASHARAGSESDHVSSEHTGNTTAAAEQSTSTAAEQSTSTAAEQSTSTAAEQSTSTAAAQKSNRAGLPIGILVALIVVLLLLCGGVAFALINQNQQPTETKEQSTASMSDLQAPAEPAKQIGPTPPSVRENATHLDLTAKTACIYDITDNTIVYDDGMHVQRQPASLTKIMTARVVLDQCRMDDSCAISANAANTEYTKIPLKAGDAASVRDLLYAILLCSSNGSATALAEHTSGSVEAFAEAMNAGAAAIGCQETSFQNAHGLYADGHLTSAYDMALITAHAYENETFRTIFGTDNYEFITQNYGEYCACPNDNALLGTPGLKGGKYGFIDASGRCYSGVYESNGKLYAFVLLGADTIETRLDDARKMMAYIDQYC